MLCQLSIFGVILKVIENHIVKFLFTHVMFKAEVEEVFIF